MPFTKRFTRVGNSTAIILDRPLLQQADMAMDTEVEISVENHAIVIRPHRYAPDAEAISRAREVMQRRSKMMKRLAR
jgi:antitoxin component of MazEF toxin-antitoxin module